MAIFTNESGEDNAADQVEGATRSTIVNLFHLAPLKYSSVSHTPSNVAWGHHICNTRLGQRACQSLSALIDMNRKLAILANEDEILETFGWISDDDQMIRSPQGAVWIQIVDDMNGGNDDIPPGAAETIIIGKNEEVDGEDDTYEEEEEAETK